MGRSACRASSPSIPYTTLAAASAVGSAWSVRRRHLHDVRADRWSVAPSRAPSHAPNGISQIGEADAPSNTEATMALHGVFLGR